LAAKSANGMDMPALMPARLFLCSFCALTIGIVIRNIKIVITCFFIVSDKKGLGITEFKVQQKQHLSCQKFEYFNCLGQSFRE
jgi:hypothetical protein